MKKIFQPNLQKLSNQKEDKRYFTLDYSISMDLALKKVLKKLFRTIYNLLNVIMLRLRIRLETVILVDMV